MSGSPSHGKGGGLARMDSAYNALKIKTPFTNSVDGDRSQCGNEGINHACEW